MAHECPFRPDLIPRFRPRPSDGATTGRTGCARRAGALAGPAPAALHSPPRTVFTSVVTYEIRALPATTTGVPA